MARAFEVVVPNASGLHARPAATFVKACARFVSDIRVANITTGSAEVSAKSILGVLTLGVARGHTARIRIEGEDEEAAETALRGLIESGLGEALEP